MTHIPGLMSSNGMSLSWCCIETPFFTTLSLSLNSESDKMLESFSFHHFHLVKQLLPFSCEMEQKYVVYQDRNYARNKKVEYCLFCPSFLYLFLWEEKEKQRFFKRKWLIFIYHCSYCLKGKLWLGQPSSKSSLCSHFSKLIYIQNNNAGQMHHIYRFAWYKHIYLCI